MQGKNIGFNSVWISSEKRFFERDETYQSYKTILRGQISLLVSSVMYVSKALQILKYFKEFRAI